MGLSWYNGFSPQLRMKASAWINEQIAAGNIPPPNACEVCGQDEGPIDYHAEDYSEPFGPHVYRHPLCWRCHLVLHSRFRNRIAFDRYRAMTRDGYRFAPMRRNIGAFSAWFAGAMEPPEFRGNLRARTLLDLLAIIDDRRGTLKHG